MPYTDQELLNELVKCHQENGTTSEKMLNDSSNDYPTQPTYRNRFGSLNKARKKAGVPVVKQGQKWTKEQVIETINNVVDEHGYFKLSFMDNFSGPSSKSIYTHFDSVEEALSESFERDKIDTITQKPPTYTKDELASYMKECEQIYGKVTISIINNDSYFPSSYPYQKEFGSFSEAKKYANVESAGRDNHDYYQYSAPELIEALQKCYEKRGSTLAADINEFSEGPSYTIYNRRFGSIVSARDIAGVPQPKKTDNVEKKYSSSKLIEHLKHVYKEEGDTKTDTINSVEGPSSQPYKSRFGSMKNAREIAELPVTQYKRSQQWNEVVGEDLDNIDGYKTDADRYVYVLKLDLRGEEAYYIGQTVNPYRRIGQYITTTPQMRLNKVTPYGLAASRREEYKNTGTSVKDVVYIISMYKEEDEEERNFVDRVKERERRESFTVAIDKNCTNIFGGR